LKYVTNLIYENGASNFTAALRHHVALGQFGVGVTMAAAIEKTKYCGWQKWKLRIEIQTEG